MSSGQYGAAISEQGVPVNTATDNQKVLDTRWITLDILAEPLYNEVLQRTSLAPSSNPGGTLYFDNGAIPLYQHNLGYLPAFDYDITAYNISDSLGAAGYSLFADTTYIYLITNNGVTVPVYSLTINLQLRIYTLPITQTYQAPLLQSNISVANQQIRYGAQFINPGNGNLALGVSDSQLQFSTTHRPISVLQTGTYTVTNSGALAGQIVIPYISPYPPLFQVAQYNPQGYSITPTSYKSGINLPQPLVGGLTFAGGKSNISNNTLYINGVQASLSGSFAYVLFKDPLTENTS